MHNDTREVMMEIKMNLSRRQFCKTIAAATASALLSEPLFPATAKSSTRPPNVIVTIADIARQKGYATAMYGKWHLGHMPKFLPVRQGFDEWFGLPYSNDMWPYHPEQDKRVRFPDLPLMEGEKVLNPAVKPKDQVHLTTWYAERTVKFIEQNKHHPFFIYLAHAMPHVPLYVSEKYKGKTERGIFGDVIAEIDWGVGKILDALKKHGIDKHTLVVFTSDNGPWLLYGDHAGSAKPLREGKGTCFEGGFRVPCVMRWPGKIPPGRKCTELAATIDILPTFAALIGADVPQNRIIDGKDIRSLMFGRPGAPYDKIADVTDAVRDRHPNIGACVDTGHFIRSAENPIEAIYRLKGRIFGLHVKDVAEQKKKTHDVIIGAGFLDVVAMSKALRDVNFPTDGALSLEFEGNPKNPIAEINQCISVAARAAQKVDFS